MTKLACAGAGLGLAIALVAVDVPVARACGGCFHATTDRGTSVITDHRMVLSVSTTQTVLWDQVRYSGDPSEFAWVLPVRDGARIELARGELIEALDLATATTVKGPDIACTTTTTSSSSSSSSSSSGGGSGSGGGCGGGGFGGSSNVTSLPTSGGGSSGSSGAVDSGFQGNNVVEVVAQSVVGPYQAVTLHSKQGDALGAWLTTNGFDVPDAVVPIISTYVRDGFDFIALRLRPGVGVRAMQPVRVVTPGASPVLPLRMVTAGIGANVGLTLWVISEGRWHTKNFPDALVDTGRLAWDPAQNRSNYRDLAAEALAANGGRGWLTEYARAGIDASSGSYGSGTFVSGVESLYKSACAKAGSETVACEGKGSDLPWDGGAPPDGGDAGEGDAGADDADAPDADAPDAAADAAAPDAGCTRTRPVCDSFDDIDVALVGLHRSDVWITKLRAALPAAQCSGGDLVLEGAQVQAPVGNDLRTSTFTDPTFDPCRGRGAAASPGSTTGDDDSGCACRATPVSQVPVSALFVAAAGVAVVGRIARRRRRR
ncbi:MAG TPA: DUF2330 domain-containing protein [Labilithrix sp.]|nr:DUF2330 domain-containing protein [Labilithrix sp.]